MRRYRQMAALLLACSVWMAMPTLAQEAGTESTTQAGQQETEGQGEIFTTESAAEPGAAEEAAERETLQETYTYLADTQDPHAFPETIKRGGITFGLRDVRYKITELTQPYSITTADMWVGCGYAPAQDVELDGIHYSLEDTYWDEWVQSERFQTVTESRTYLYGQEVPETLEVEVIDNVTGETMYGNIPRTGFREDGADWKEGGLEEWVAYKWQDEKWVLEVDGSTFAGTNESPWFEGCEEKILHCLHLDGAFAKVKAVAWDNEGWQDESGTWYRSCKVTGDRMLYRYLATFSGDVPLANLSMVRYTSRYVSDVTGYLVTATVTYEEEDREPQAVQMAGQDIPEGPQGGNSGGIPWQDSVMLALEIVGIALAAALAALIVYLRPKPRAWKYIRKTDRKEKEEKEG